MICSADFLAEVCRASGVMTGTDTDGACPNPMGSRRSSVAFVCCRSQVCLPSGLAVEADEVTEVAEHYGLFVCG